MYKKTTLSFLMAMLLLSTFTFVSFAFAQKGGYSGPAAQGGTYTGPGPAVMTIKNAYNQADDTWVTLRGKLINRVGGEIFTFQDASGTGKVKIDDDAWLGQHIGPNDVVELLVEVEKEWGSVELEVERITKVQ